MQVCTSLQTDNHTSTPQLSFLQAGCPSCHPTNKVKALTLKAAVTNNIYSTIATSILEYMFITVTCCEKIAKKTILASASASLPRKFQDFSGPNSFSRTFQVLKILQTQSQDFPGPGNFINTIPGLSRSWKFYKYNPRTFHEARRTLHFRMQY